MTQRRFTIIFLLALTAVVFLASRKEPRRADSRAILTSRDAVESKTIETESQRPAGSGDRRKILSLVTLTQDLLNSNLSFEDRLASWEALNKGMPATAEWLYRVAVAENPYKDRPQHAHSLSSLQFGREESFRIMALQSLEALSMRDERYLHFIQQISQRAKSAGVRAIAQKMIPYAKRGMSYSGLMEQALVTSR